VNGELITPSVVVLEEGAAPVVGRAAVGHPNALVEFKRLMGTSYAAWVGANADAEGGDGGSAPRREVVPGPGGHTDDARLAPGGLSPARLPGEAAAALLGVLVKAAAASTGDVIDRAVVAVPVAFGRRPIEVTFAAAAKAGLRHCTPLQEPVAAALANGVDGVSLNEETALVFDLGGGTCDVSLLEGFAGIIEVIATAGDRRLGGIDMDAAPANLAQRRGARVGSNDGGGEDCAALLSAAEAAKVELSSADSANLAGVAVTRAEFEEAIAPLLRRMAEGPLRSVGEQAALAWAWTPWGGVSGDDASQAPLNDSWAPPPRRVTRVALVGAATRVPAERAPLARMTGFDDVGGDRSVDPELAVALGCACHAAILSGDLSSLEILDGAYNATMHKRASGFD